MPLHRDAKEIAPKVEYDWDMFVYFSERIKREYLAADKRTKNLLLEGFLLHARILYDFLVKSPCREDDVSATHFFDDASEWCTVRSDFCPYLRENKTRLNKKLAHLTYSRLTEEEEWEDGTIFDEIFRAWHTFLEKLPEDRREWFA